MRGRDARGFTLIEVIAAIVLLSLAFAALLTTLGGATRLAVNADAHTRAALCAQSALDSAFVFKPVRRGTSHGQCDKQYRWQLRVSPWQPPHPGKLKPRLDLFRLDLTVSWDAGGHRRKASFSTLRAQGQGRFGLPQEP